MQLTPCGSLDREGALLGLIDDVDCAVVSVTCNTADPPASALEHVASIPAFAYVATGAHPVSKQDVVIFSLEKHMVPACLST